MSHISRRPRPSASSPDVRTSNINLIYPRNEGTYNTCLLHRCSGKGERTAVSTRVTLDRACLTSPYATLFYGHTISLFFLFFSIYIKKNTNNLTVQELVFPLTASCMWVELILHFPISGNSFVHSQSFYLNTG